MKCNCLFISCCLEMIMSIRHNNRIYVCFKCLLFTFSFFLQLALSWLSERAIQLYFLTHSRLFFLLQLKVKLLFLPTTIISNIKFHGKTYCLSLLSQKSSFVCCSVVFPFALHCVGTEQQFLLKFLLLPPFCWCCLFSRDRSAFLVDIDLAYGLSATMLKSPR